MKRAEIEAKIDGVQRLLAQARHPSTLATLNRCLDKLIMMDADDEQPAHTYTTTNQGNGFATVAAGRKATGFAKQWRASQEKEVFVFEEGQIRAATVAELAAQCVCEPDDFIHGDYAYLADGVLRALQFGMAWVIHPSFSNSVLIFTSEGLRKMSQALPVIDVAASTRSQPRLGFPLVSK